MAVGHDHVGITRKLHWDGASIVAQRREHHLALVDETAVRGTGWHVLVLENEALTNLDASSVVDLDGRERLEREVGALRTRGDELGSDGEDATGSKRSVESVGDGRGLSSNAEERLMPGLDSGNAGSSAEHHGRVDQRSSTEVGGKANSLELVGGRDHALGVGEAKLVRALLDWLSTRSFDSLSKSDNVCRFGCRNLFESLIVGPADTDGGEVGLREHLKTLVVEGGFEMLSSQSAIAY